MEGRKNLVERIYISRSDLQNSEKAILRDEHLRRYAAIRRFCYGKTLDVACGCGYGSYLLAVNPDISEILAVDSSNESIDWARQEFTHPKISYQTLAVEKIEGKFDTLVCLETIEHLKDTKTIPTLVERCEIDNLIISFPDKKTTHYNPFHFHDFVVQDIIALFEKHLSYHAIRFVDSTSVMLIRAPKSAPTHIFRNLRDL